MTKRKSASTSQEARGSMMLQRLKDQYELGKLACSGEVPLAQLANDKGLSIGNIRRLRLFAERYTQQQFTDFRRLRRPNGLPLHFGYIRYLLVVKDKSERRELEKQAAAEGWLAPRLAQEIRSRYRTANQAHGRSLTTPASLGAGLRQVMDEANRLRQRSEIIRGMLGKRLKVADKKLAVQAMTVAKQLKSELTKLMNGLKVE